MTDLVSILGKAGPRATAAADAVCDIVIKGAALGEKVAGRVRGPDGAVRDVRLPRAEWFTRIATAAERGVFERQAPGDIVDRILMTEAPSEGADHD